MRPLSTNNRLKNKVSISDKTTLFKLPSSFKLFLLLSSIIYFCGFKQNDKVGPNYQRAKIDAIAQIKNPHERALYWFLHVYVALQSNPKEVNQTLPIIAETLWSDDYTHKEATLLVTKAEIMASQGDYEQSQSNILNAIYLLESKELKHEAEKRILCMTYLAFSQHSQYSKEKLGLEYAYKGLALASDIHFVSGQVLAHNQIGQVIGYSKKNYSLALNHFTQAEALLPQLPKPIYDFISGFIIGNIARIWSQLGAYEKSIKYKLQLLEKENINLELLLVTLSNIGEDYYKLKKYDLAEKHLQKALDLMEKNGVDADRGIPMLRMGFIQLEKGKITKAFNYANAIDDWLLNHKFKGNHKVIFYQLKSKIANAHEDYELAIHWLKKATTEQSELQTNTVNNLVELETNNKLREIEQERLLLEKEKELNQATINFQKLLLLSIGFLMVLSIWFGITFYEKNKEVTEAYEYILGQKNKKKEPINSTKKIIEAQTVSNPKNIDEALKQKIIHSLSIDKSFLSSDLTLKKFADLVESNTSYVSQTINVGFEKNFNVLINEYRVAEVLRLFHEGHHQTFTIESIYQKAGFKSKSSFQKAFKAKTGVTATYYLNHIS